MRIRTGMAVVFLACSCVFVADTLEDEFRNPPPWTRPWCYWFFGPANGTAEEPTLNGKRFETLWMPPFEVDVTGLLEPGENRLQIEVTSRCPAESAGLRGPVRLQATSMLNLVE